MKTILLAFLAAFSFVAASVFGAALEDQFLKEVGPLIGKVRGAVRYQIEQGKGCLPWASLGSNVGGQQSFTDFGFTPEMAKELGEDVVPKIASRLSTVAQKSAFNSGAIGLCEKTQFSEGSQSLNAIVLYIERQDGVAFKMIFPFQQTSQGQVSYIDNRASLELVQSRLFNTDQILVPTPSGELDLRFPRHDWLLQNTKRRADGNGYYLMFTSSQSKLNVSFFVERVSKCKTSSDCREFFWANPGPGYKDAQEIERFDRNVFAIMKSVVPVTVGTTVQKQLNYSAHVVREDYWIDLHLSKMPFETTDADLFNRFIDSVELRSR